MPKDTFHHLPEAKKQQILAVVKQEFEDHPLASASVKDIVNALGIARGSFYTYCENLEESYFTILDAQTVEIHDVFLRLMEEPGGDLWTALTRFGEVMADELFRSDKYALYRNRYLYWTPDLELQWKEFRQMQRPAAHQDQEARLLEQGDLRRNELMHLIKAMIHDLIRRLFIDGWDRATFLSHYGLQLELIRPGLTAVSTTSRS